MNYITDKLSGIFLSKRTEEEKTKLICVDITNQFEKCLAEYQSHKLFHACVKNLPFDFFHKNCTNKLGI